MVSAYAAYANKGVYSKPFAITKIEDRYGNTIRDYAPAQYEVLSEEIAYLMTNLMQTVMDRGTGGSSRWKYNFTRPAAGKTGTTQGWSDAWFVGFTPQLAAGVWFGVDDYQVSLGPGQDGSKAALPSWAKFMRNSHKILELPRVKFQKPNGVVVSEICSVSKMSSRKACPVEKEVYKAGSEPSQKCRIHRN